jgi:hypothetical protein
MYFTIFGVDLSVLHWSSRSLGRLTFVLCSMWLKHQPGSVPLRVRCVGTWSRSHVTEWTPWKHGQLGIWRHDGVVFWRFDHEK